MPDPALIAQFMERAEAAAAKVQRVDSMHAAFEYAVRACLEKEACQILASGCEFPLSEPAEELCGLKQWQKLIAAPGMDPAEMESLAGLCREAGVGLIEKGLHRHLGGIDIGLTRADYGIAETGTLVLECAGENLRLATMISEIHIAILRAADICPDAYAIEEGVERFFSDGPGFAAFITGPSRTADIERVLTLGVHGPLELHVLILDEK